VGRAFLPALTLRHLEVTADWLSVTNLNILAFIDGSLTDLVTRAILPAKPAPP
jgi:hypothetical protein